LFVTGLSYDTINGAALAIASRAQFMKHDSISSEGTYELSDVRSSRSAQYISKKLHIVE